MLAELAVVLWLQRREVAEVQFCNDTGGNAEKFCGRNAEEGLSLLKTSWSKAWKEQGQGMGPGVLGHCHNETNFLCH